MYVYVARHIQFFQAVSTNTPKKSFDLSLVSTTLRCLDCRFHPLSLQPSTQEASERSVKGGPCQLCGQLLQQWHLSLARENRQGNDVTHTIHGTMVYLPTISPDFISIHLVASGAWQVQGDPAWVGKASSCQIDILTMKVFLPSW